MESGRAARWEPQAIPSLSGPAVEASGLTKHFGELVEVEAVTFAVHRGEIFAFLGPNGAGKSTTIKMLCALLQPTRGQATVAGFGVIARPKAVRRRIGLVFQEQTLDQQLTAEENLRFHAVLYRVARDEVDARITRVLELSVCRSGARIWSRRSQAEWRGGSRSRAACCTP